MMNKKQLVTILIPCHNEAENILKVITNFHKSYLAKAAFDFDILVIDNVSSDNTAEIARKAGARVIRENKKGKGYAIRCGFKNINPDSRYVVMLDGDNTYKAEEVLRLLEPLYHEFCDVIVGSRLGGKMSGNSMTMFNRLGNWGFTFLTRIFYRTNVTDVLSGYFAWKREVIEDLAPHLKSSGFALEMEIVTKLGKMGYEVHSVPISYYQRGGKTNLHPLKDGLKILLMFLSNILWTSSKTNEPASIKSEAFK
jgi:glycosyltransferase involved in cell wall biosynthesis